MRRTPEAMPAPGGEACAPSAWRVWCHLRPFVCRPWSGCRPRGREANTTARARQRRSGARCWGERCRGGAGWPAVPCSLCTGSSRDSSASLDAAWARPACCRTVQLLPHAAESAHFCICSRCLGVFPPPQAQRTARASAFPCRLAVCGRAGGSAAANAGATSPLPKPPGGHRGERAPQRGLAQPPADHLPKQAGQPEVSPAPRVLRLLVQPPPLLLRPLSRCLEVAASQAAILQ